MCKSVCTCVHESMRVNAYVGVYMCECVPVHSSCLKVAFKDTNSSVAAELGRNVSIRLEILGVSSRLCLPCFCRNFSMVELCLVKEFFCEERHLVVPFVFSRRTKQWSEAGRKAYCQSPTLQPLLSCSPIPAHCC